LVKALRQACLAGFDSWMQRNYPNLPWGRYADDGLIHCQTFQEAEAVKAALQERLEECELELHPDRRKSSTAKTDAAKEFEQPKDRGNTPDNGKHATCNLFRPWQSDERRYQKRLHESVATHRARNAQAQSNFVDLRALVRSCYRCDDLHGATDDMPKPHTTTATLATSNLSACHTSSVRSKKSACSGISGGKPRPRKNYNETQPVTPA
jgi:hypothetical protein